MDPYIIALILAAIAAVWFANEIRKSFRSMS